MTPEASLEKAQVEAPKKTLTPDQSLKDLISSVSDICYLLINISHGAVLKIVWDGITVLSDFRTIASEVPAIVAQYQGLDDQSRAELLAYVSSTISFPDNSNVQLIVEKLLDVAVDLSLVFQLIDPPAPVPPTPPTP